MIDSLLSIGFKNISLKRPSNFGGRCFFIIMASGFNRNIFVVLLSTLKLVLLVFFIQVLFIRGVIVIDCPRGSGIPMPGFLSVVQKREIADKNALLTSC